MSVAERGKTERTIYSAIIIGVWLAVVIVIPLAHYVTIPPMKWMLAAKIGICAGMVSTPLFLLCAWLTLCLGEKGAVTR